MIHLEMDKKVIGGKYVKIELDVENNVIKNAIISGDFFAFPIEEFEKFLNALKGIKFTVEEIESVLEEYEKKIVFSGIGMDDLKGIFLQLLKRELI